MKITLRHGRWFRRIYNFYFDYTHRFWRLLNTFEYFWILLYTLPTSNSWRGLWRTSLKQWCSLLVLPSSRSSMWWVCGDDHEDDDEDYGGRDTKTFLVLLSSRSSIWWVPIDDDAGDKKDDDPDDHPVQFDNSTKKNWWWFCGDGDENDDDTDDQDDHQHRPVHCH